ncbi:MAG: transporter substrate-binding domain-containing protein [Deltaproteobacteria bacterium]|nr:transporter substrate-binding domain-containing protein [Deltaproteobacteria bacterium]
MARLSPSLALVAAASLLACERAPPPPPPPPAAPADPEIVEVKAEGAPKRELLVDTGDLDAVLKRGALRVLIFGAEETVLPRNGASTATDVVLAEAFAHDLGVRVETIAVPRFADLIPMLLEGKGDLIAARLADTRARRQRIAFSRPTTTVSELLIGKKGDAAVPKKLAELAGATVTVRASSSYKETLDALAAKDAQGLLVADAPEDRDTPLLVADVAAGKLALTACDSDLFAHVSAYQPDAVALFPLKEGRVIAFGLRPTNPKLKAAADAWLVQHALHAHATEAAQLDLEQIKKRGSLRVLTRNNAVSYFLHKGQQQGFDYELIKLFAKDHGLRVDVVVPPEASDLMPWLLAGKGDVIAAQLTVTDARKRDVAFSAPYLFADEVLVQPAAAPPLAALAELKGTTLHVRKSSSYRSTLDALQAQHGPFTVVDAPEDQETEQLIAKVGDGTMPLTVADSTIAAVELAYRTDVQATLPLKTGAEIAFAVRPTSTALRGALDAFVKKRFRGLEYNVLKQRYFTERRASAGGTAAAPSSGSVSDYDALMKERARQYGLDWRLLAAQAYQESRFDPKAKSWVGAQGLFQVMPATGREMGFTDLEDPGQGVHAGAQYMAKLIDSFDSRIPFKQRVRFALAAYNAGRGHVEDARLLAAEQGLDPNRWFGNVEKTMLLLQQPKYARRARHGYCRGEEPVKYVSEIQSRYDNWLSVVKDTGVDASKAP